MKEFGCKSFIREVIREIGESESMFDNTGPKAFSVFLSEVTKNAPDLVLPVMGMLTPYLECDVSAISTHGSFVAIERTPALSVFNFGFFKIIVVEKIINI